MIRQALGVEPELAATIRETAAKEEEVVGEVVAGERHQRQVVHLLHLPGVFLRVASGQL